MYTYLLINLFSLFATLGLAFLLIKNFTKKILLLSVAISITAIFLLIWDIIFTHIGVWGFNNEYLIGIHLFNLPIEEVLFFFCIPFACFFIYELVKKFELGKNLSENRILSFLLIFVLVYLFSGILFQKTYTFVVAILALILVNFSRIFNNQNINSFIVAYLLSLIPFVIINSILTHGLGFISPNPIVWYDDTYILSFRIGTIPVEDFLYNFILLLPTQMLYEFLINKFNHKVFINKP